jgi:hypothetical protein
MKRSYLFFEAALLLLSLSAWAHEEATPYSVLSSALSNKVEILAEHRDLGIDFNEKNFPAIANADASSICKDIGVDGPIATYYGDPGEISPDPVASNLKRDAVDFLKSLDRAQSNPYQIQLQSATADEKVCREVALAQYCDNPAKQFKSASYLDAKLLTNKSNAALVGLLGNPSNTSSGSGFVKSILELPKSYAELPALLQSARTSGDDRLERALQEAISKALLLTLNGVVPTADFHNPAYPYFDELVPASSMLQIDQLYQKLKALNHWPELIDFTPEDRATLGGVYLKKTADNSRWIVKGFYDERHNQVQIDLANDFYENLFVYYHELWHVAWAHSKYSNDQVKTIVDTLSSPPSEEQEKKLRNEILSLISLNEFMAVDQQIRLFHAIGPITEEWSTHELESSKGWHDSYLGDDYNLLIPLEFRKSGRPLPSWLKYTLLPTMGLTLPIYLHVDHKQNRILNEKRLVAKSLDDSYWQERKKIHSEVFEKQYFGEVLDLTPYHGLVNAEDLLNSEFQIPGRPKITCEDLEKIRLALGSDWQFGDPFDYEITDSKPCVPSSGPIRPGTEGTHGGIDAFPSLEAPVRK